MVSLTRRHALRGVGGVLAALAGCSSDPSPTGTPAEPDGRQYENLERDPDHVALRNRDREPTVWLAPEETDADEPTEDRRMNRPERGLIADRKTAEGLRYADVPGVEEAEAFVAETDFASETLLLDSRGVQECYELRLCYLTWSAEEYQTWYLRTYRPADVACETDDRDQMAHLIRIPDALDPDEVRGSGSGVSSNRCSGERRFETGARTPTSTHGTTGDRE